MLKTNKQHMSPMNALLFVALLFPFAAFAQTEKRSGIPYKDGQIFYERVVEVNGATKDQLFSATKAALAKVFKSSKAVIQSEDRESGTIVGKGNYTFDFTYMLAVTPVRASFTLEIKTKDGKYRMQMTDFEVRQGKGTTYACPMDKYHSSYDNGKKWAEEFFSELDRGANNVLKSIETEAARSSASDKDDF